METTEQYLIEYKAFIDSYKRSEVSGEEVGELIARMAQYFAMQNLKTVACERDMYIIGKDIESRADEGGKVISSAKAQAIISATPEADKYRTARAHRDNIEQCINALKSLQKGVLSEYISQGNT